MIHPIVVTAPDRLRLKQMIRALRVVGDPLRYYLDALDERLNQATVVAHDEIDPQVVTMNSRIRLSGETPPASQVIELVHVDEANPAASKLSVITPLGTRLLGARAGETVRWRSRYGQRAARIEEVLFQPEAAERHETLTTKEYSHDRATK